ncbi:MAG: tetratricopeptide repeat protein [Desulfovibrio sp.]|uniref:tetratricopeptide repeat protein n=1 Tax=Desulfovibrio sp. 7SRBS1 TaxID=3378064 RepID=UPI003B40E665
MNKSIQKIKTHLARSKAYYNRNEILRSLVSLAEALKLELSVKLSGQDKLVVLNGLREMTQLLGRIEEVKKYCPAPLVFSPGQERNVLVCLAKTIKVMHAVALKEDHEKAMERKISIDKLMLHGQTCLQNGKISEAEKAFNEAIELYVDEKALFSMIGTSLIEAGQERLAVKYFIQAMEEYPDDAQSYLKVAEAYQKADNPKSGIRALKRGMKHLGKRADFYLQIALLEQAQGNTKEALQSVTESLALDEHNYKAKKLRERLAGKA